MIVEDEPIVAHDIRFMLEDAGFKCIGPYRSVAEALQSLDSHDPDFALLDVNLTDGQVFPVADVLSKRGTPFAFCSAHFLSSESEQLFPGVEIVGKPFAEDDLLAAVKASGL